MSNCITTKTEIILYPEHFVGIDEVFDLDGNRIFRDMGVWVLTMAPLTTWREWDQFLRDHVWPFAIHNGVRLRIPVRDEDNPSEGYRMTVFKSPLGQ